MTFESLQYIRKSKSIQSKTVVIASTVLSFSLLSGCSSTPSSNDSEYLRLGQSHYSSTGNGHSRCGTQYKVKRGDTLSTIAVKCKINMDQLAYANDLLPPYTIYLNQKLVIPQNGSTAKKHFERSLISKKSASWKWPMDTKLQYQYKRDPSGLNSLEIYGVPGLPVKAVEQGEVVYAGDGIAHFGLLVMIKHPSGYLSTYAHNSRLLVKEGQAVKSGQTIASLGASGETDRPKLYLEARYRGRKVDVKKLFNGH